MFSELLSRCTVCLVKISSSGTQLSCMCVSPLLLLLFLQLLSDSDKIPFLVETDLRATSTAFFVSPVNFRSELPLPFPMGCPWRDIGDIYLLLETTGPWIPTPECRRSAAD